MTTTDSARRRGRVELGVAVLLAAVGGGVVLFAVSRQWWVELTPRPEPLPSVREEITGTDVAPWAAAMGLVGLAGAVALLATRRLGRLAVGLLMVCAGVSIVAAGVEGAVGLNGSGTDGGSAVDGEALSRRVDVVVTWPILAATAGVLGVVSGMLVCLRFRRWSTQSAGLGSRYDAPTGRPGTETATGAAGTVSTDPTQLWDALDRGIDPTKPVTPLPPTRSSRRS